MSWGTFWVIFSQTHLGHHGHSGRKSCGLKPGSNPTTVSYSAVKSGNKTKSLVRFMRLANYNARVVVGAMVNSAIVGLAQAFIMLQRKLVYIGVRSRQTHLTHFLERRIFIRKLTLTGRSAFSSVSVSPSLRFLTADRHDSSLEGSRTTWKALLPGTGVDSTNPFRAVI
jgi:hypothetical protein